MDCAEKKDVRPDQIDKVDIKDPDNLTGKYVSKARKMVSKTFAKRALQWFPFIHFINTTNLHLSKEHLVRLFLFLSKILTYKLEFLMFTLCEAFKFFLAVIYNQSTLIRNILRVYNKKMKMFK